MLRNEGFVEHIEIWAYLAKCDSTYIGVIAFYECVSIYAGGVFGEISEFYVPIDYRSRGISYRLLNAAFHKALLSGWICLEESTPPANEMPGMIKFYEQAGFKYVSGRYKLLYAY